MSALVAATVDVTTTETTVEVGGVVGSRNVSGSSGGHDIRAGSVVEGVPLQLGIAIGIQHIYSAFLNPSLGLDLQTGEVEGHTVLDRACRITGIFQHTVGLLLGLRTNHTARVFRVVGGCHYVGIITSAYELIEDDNLLVEVNGIVARPDHTTSVTTTEERTYLAGIIYIALRIAVFCILEYYTGLNGHGTAFHVLGKLRLVFQIHRAEVIVIISCIHSVAGCCIHVLSIPVQDVFRHHVGSVVSQEHVVHDGVGTYLQFHFGSRSWRYRTILRFQAGTVTTQINRTSDDGRMISISSSHQDRHLLGIGTEDTQCVGRSIISVKCERTVAAIYSFLSFYFTRVIIEVPEAGKGTQSRIVGIRVRTVATAIDVAIDGSVDS